MRYDAGMDFSHDKLRIELARRDVAQARIAEALEVTPQTVNNWVRGRAAPDAWTLVRILRAAGVTDEELRNERVLDWYPQPLNGDG